jgi:hypothetical protein
MSLPSVQSHGTVALLNAVYHGSAGENVSARLGDTGKLMPPRSTPNVGRSIMPDWAAMLKKS